MAGTGMRKADASGKFGKRYQVGEAVGPWTLVGKSKRGGWIGRCQCGNESYLGKNLCIRAKRQSCCHCSGVPRRKNAHLSKLLKAGAKPCGVCGQVKNPVEFHVKKTNIGGRANVCIECERATHRDIYRKNKENRISVRQSMLRNGETIVCRVCQRELPASRFWASNAMPNGSCAVCVGCVSRPDILKHTRRFGSARRSACYRARPVEWSLEFEEWRGLIACGKCHYCGGDLPRTGSGLDRKDNQKGYSLENCVPCCRPCNVAKNSTFSYAEMLLIGASIREVWKRRQTGG